MFFPTSLFLLLRRQYDQWYRALRLLAAGGLPQSTDVKTARYPPTLKSYRKRRRKETFVDLGMLLRGPPPPPPSPLPQKLTT